MWYLSAICIENELQIIGGDRLGSSCNIFRAEDDASEACGSHGDAEKRLEDWRLALILKGEIGEAEILHEIAIIGDVKVKVKSMTMQMGLRVWMMLLSLNS